MPRLGLKKAHICRQISRLWGRFISLVKFITIIFSDLVLTRCILVGCVQILNLIVGRERMCCTAMPLLFL